MIHFVVLMVGISGCKKPPASASSGRTADTGVGVESVPLPTADTAVEPACEAATVCDEVGICWVTLCGGSFRMGSDLESDEIPIHEVSVPDFEIMQTEVTIAHYNQCVAAGACVDPEAVLTVVPEFCVGNPPDRPRGCLDWVQAGAFCEWAGGRLPTEAEWEYAARSRGHPMLFPWGDDDATCKLAILGYTDGDPCGGPGPARVCSRPEGYTEQGLCDMAGNVFEWVLDVHHASYEGAPGDGTAWVDEGPWRVMRGGGINSDATVRVSDRTYHEPEFAYSGTGARCVR